MCQSHRDKLSWRGKVKVNSSYFSHLLVNALEFPCQTGRRETKTSLAQHLLTTQGGTKQKQGQYHPVTPGGAKTTVGQHHPVTPGDAKPTLEKHHPVTPGGAKPKFFTLSHRAART